MVKGSSELFIRQYRNGFPISSERDAFHTDGKAGRYLPVLALALPFAVVCIFMFFGDFVSQKRGNPPDGGISQRHACSSCGRGSKTRFAKLSLLALLVHVIDLFTGKYFNVSIVMIAVGVLAGHYGILEKDPLKKANSFGILMMALVLPCGNNGE